MRNASVAALLLLLVAGCATPPVDPNRQAEAWTAHSAWLAQISEWRTSGKVAVDVPEDSWSAGLRWSQGMDRYSIWLGGPFGQGAVKIEGDHSSVTLRTAEGRTVRAATPEQLVSSELGADVPISKLRHWVLGRPDPGDSVTQMTLDEQGRLETLRQSGWQVSYLEYQEAGAGFLPKRLEIRRGDLRARLVLGSWRLGA